MLILKLLVLVGLLAIVTVMQLSAAQAIGLGFIAIVTIFGFSGLGVVALLVYAAIAFVVLNADFRKKFITNKILAWYKSVLPEISETEQIAIDAGTVWWDRDLFTGDPDWDKWLVVPAPKLTEEEQAYIDGPIDEFCQMLDEWEITAGDNDLPQEAWDHISKHKIFGLIIPKQYGGMGADQLKELKRLQKENERLRRAVSDLTLDKLILSEAARGNY